MQDEALSSVPRKDRPLPEDLEDYKTVYPEGDPDYNDVRPELNAWLYDYRRKQDEDRGTDDGRIPFEEDELVQGGRSGYDPTQFDALRSAIQRAPSAPPR